MDGAIRLSHTASKYGMIGSENNIHITQNTYYDGTGWKALGHFKGKASIFSTNLAADVAFSVLADNS